MTTLDDVAKKKQVEQSAEQQAAVEFGAAGEGARFVADWARGFAQTADQNVARKRAQRGDDRALGYEKHDPPGAGTENIRNGIHAGTVLTDCISTEDDAQETHSVRIFTESCCHCDPGKPTLLKVLERSECSP